MRKYGGIKFKSLWDGSTWFIIGLVAIFTVLPCFLDKDGVAPVLIASLSLIFVITALSSIYYKIDGDNLVVYEGFIPKAYPISRIKTIRQTNNILSAPATSFKRRLAITFSDSSILKSSAPLMISPVHQDEFIRLLRQINPGIEYLH
ncbi:MAG: PH domain-containing protein [Muribaculaceae bacterium]|nr:PH domain-containing protein [Muribaculaceae bacterium]